MDKQNLKETIKLLNFHAERAQKWADGLKDHATRLEDILLDIEEKELEEGWKKICI
jgi:hypothetical protein